MSSTATTAAGDCSRFQLMFFDEEDRDGYLATLREHAVTVFTGLKSEIMQCPTPKDGIYICYFDHWAGRFSVRLEGDETRGYAIKKWFFGECELADLPSEFAQFVWKVSQVTPSSHYLERHKAREDSETATKKRERSSSDEEEDAASEAAADDGLAKEPVAKKARPTSNDPAWFSEEAQAERAEREKEKIAKLLKIALRHVNASNPLHALNGDCINIPIKEKRLLQLVFRRHTLALGTKGLRLESWAICPMGGYFPVLPDELKAMRFELLSVDHENQTGLLKLQKEEEAVEADDGLAKEPVAKKARPTIHDADWHSEENQAERAKREEKKIAKYLAIARNHVAAHKDRLALTRDCIGIPISRGRKLELVFRRCEIKAGTKDLRFESWAICPMGGYFKDLPAELKAMRFELLSVDRENQTAELKLQEEEEQEASLYI